MKSNTELQRDVMNELRWEPVLSSGTSEIGVTAREGAITLVGEVNSYAKKLAALRAARRVKGVKAVALELEVVLPGEHSYSDSELAQSISHALRWHTGVAENEVKATVQNGFVFLDGEVDWPFQKKAAETALENLLGIRGITNRIKIRPQINVADIRKDIFAAFHRSATVDAGSILIDVSHGRVTLLGKVRSWAEKIEAENSAWKAPGVAEVINKIEVDNEMLVWGHSPAG
jgi:osmotically-inducible protein OsmY